MIDLGISKLALIGAVALIVIGPEKLPRVARTVGMLLGKAQRYVNDVKAEVNRSMDLDELRKMNQNGLLPLVFAHLFSLSQTREIFSRQVEQGKGPVNLPQSSPQPVEA